MGGAGATIFTGATLAGDEHSSWYMCSERVSSSSYAETESSGVSGSFDAAGIDIRPEEDEGVQGVQGAEGNEDDDEGVNEVGRDKEPPNSCRSSVDDRFFGVSSELSTRRFDLLFRVLGPIGAV